MEEAVRRALASLGGVLRVSGQSLYRLGCKTQGALHSPETLSRHKAVLGLDISPFVEHKGPKKPMLVQPKIGEDVFIAPNAAISGDVSIADKSSVWYGASIRGDLNPVYIGQSTAILDNAVIHVAKYGIGNANLPTKIGNGCVVGLASIVHAATIEDECLIGHGAVILDGVHISKHAIIGSGAMVTPNTKVGEMELWEGSPAKFVRKVTAQELDERLFKVSELYLNIAVGHAEENVKTWQEIEGQKLRFKIRSERTEDHASHVGTLGKEEEMIENQAFLQEQEWERQRKIGEEVKGKTKKLHR
eukprot:CAMPEP_0184695620 /NCGR_PEP_ID=MMETSP0313-20130426/3200_1 /TAXON_ID=2792 /ORGANISM="Porphyridium aerugineum, Strain SAG 1380-2" /LENGTH=302 /DNA_ID=CAMNT_0027154117 /DNA_START=56 /DNA_END=964 /DNA_ORIENTATION=+